jgi:hypothetical protein
MSIHPLKEGEMKRMGLMIASLVFFLFAQVAQADWTPARRLTWTSGYSENPAIAVDSSGNLHVVWSDTVGSHDLYYKKSTDGGATWTVTKRITWTSGYSIYPTIAVDSSDNLHLVWRDDTGGNNEIYYKKSTDGGVTWTTSQRLTWTSGISWDPAIAISPSGNLHVVWYDGTGGNNEIYYKKSTNGGAKWSASQRLTWTSGYSEYPAVLVDSSGNVHVVWQAHIPVNSEIYYKRSTDGGATWTPSQRLTWNSYYSGSPAIAVDSSGNLHVVWYDSATTNFEIHYRKSTDGGTTWTPSQRLTWTPGYSENPAIAVDSSGNLHVVWDDDTPGNYEIYYKRSTDGGATWTPSQRLTNTSGVSWYPAIGVRFTGELCVLWQDLLPDNWEIYYERFIK